MSATRQIGTMNKLFALFLLASFAACGETAAPAVEVARSVNEVAITSGTPVTMADLSISGMTCAMGCGGTIKNALVKLPGVTDAEVDFTDATKANHVVVTYDPAQVSDADMVKAVQAIHDGQYKVESVGITKQVLKVGASDAPAEEATDAKVSASLESVALPSLVALLQRLVRI